MSYGKVSARAEVYARALFELTPTEETLKRLGVVEKGLADPFIQEFLKSPLISRAEKKKVLQSALRESPPLERDFIFLLTDRNSASLLGEIKWMFQYLLDEKLERVRGEVTSSRPLSLEEKTALQENLEKLLKKQVILEEKISSEYIGGLYIKAGGLIFNDTLDFHLKTFQNTGG